MPAFELYIADDRGDTLGLRIVEAQDIERARELAEALLSESQHYTGVEARLTSGRVFGIGSLANEERPTGIENRAST